MFKKIIAVFSLLLLVSCSGTALSTEEVSMAYQQGFTCKATAVYAEDETEMKIEKNGLSIKLNVLSPAELSGLSIEISGGKLTADFEGMNTELDVNGLPSAGPLKLFCNLIETLSLPDEFSVTQRGSEVTALGKDFSAGLDPESLGLLKAEFPNEGVEFIFSEWAFSEE